MRLYVMPNSGDQKAGFVTAFGVFPGSPYSLFLGHFWSGYQKEQGFFLFLCLFHVQYYHVLSPWILCHLLFTLF